MLSSHWDHRILWAPKAHCEEDVSVLNAMLPEFGAHTPDLILNEFWPDKRNQRNTRDRELNSSIYSLCLTSRRVWNSETGAINPILSKRQWWTHMLKLSQGWCMANTKLKNAQRVQLDTLKSHFAQLGAQKLQLSQNLCNLYNGMSHFVWFSTCRRHFQNLYNLARTKLSTS